MQVEKLTEANYEKWDDFCEKSDNAWFWHTSGWLQYCLNFKPEVKAESKSFMVFDNNRLVAICPLVLENNDGDKEFSFMSGYYIPAPALANDLTKKIGEKVMKLIFKHVDDLADENRVKRTSFTFPVLDKSHLETHKQTFNYLVKFGYFDSSIITWVINLDRSLEELRLDVRHGHDSDIEKSSKILKAEIFYQDNISRDIFDQYVDLHAKAAGRVTRPRSTFDKMFDFIKNGNGFLVGAKKDEVYIGFSYFYIYKNNVYYGSSCNDPDVNNIAVGHFIQWQAIIWMKSRKCGFYEIGWPNYFGILSHFPSQKEIEIGKFKRGFGGFAIPTFRGEKYYDKSFFLKVYNSRINQFAETIK